MDLAPSLLWLQRWDVNNGGWPMIQHREENSFLKIHTYGKISSLQSSNSFKKKAFRHAAVLTNLECRIRSFFTLCHVSRLRRNGSNLGDDEKLTMLPARSSPQNIRNGVLLPHFFLGHHFTSRYRAVKWPPNEIRGKGEIWIKFLFLFMGEKRLVCRMTTGKGQKTAG